jgi:hypothetical protein
LLLRSASDDTVTTTASGDSLATVAAATPQPQPSGDTGSTSAAATAAAAGGAGGLTIDMRGISNTKSPEPGAVDIQKLGSDHVLRPVADDEWWPDAIAAGAYYRAVPRLRVLREGLGQQPVSACVGSCAL